VTLGRKFVLYLVLVHLALAGAAVGLYRIGPWWTILAEAVLLASLLTGIMLLRQSRMTREQGMTALALIRSGEFTTRLLDTGVPEVDALVSAYNAMSGDLREQRVRLQEQQWFLEKIVAASPSGIVTLDLDGRIADANPAARRWFGAREESFRGRRLDELPGAFGTGLAGIGSGESRLVTEAGPRKFRCRVTEFVNLGFPRRFLLIDELSEELHRSERAAFEKLIRVMAHEINNSVGAGNSLLASCKAFAAELNPDSRREFEAALGLAIARGEHLNPSPQPVRRRVGFPRRPRRWTFRGAPRVGTPDASRSRPGHLVADRAAARRVAGARGSLPSRAGRDQRLEERARGGRNGGHDHGRAHCERRDRPVGDQRQRSRHRPHDRGPALLSLLQRQIRRSGHRVDHGARDPRCAWIPVRPRQSRGWRRRLLDRAQVGTLPFFTQTQTGRGHFSFSGKAPRIPLCCEKEKCPRSAKNEDADASLMLFPRSCPSGEYFLFLIKAVSGELCQKKKIFPCPTTLKQ
jgi:PAS domain-containing protein